MELRDEEAGGSQTSEEEKERDRLMSRRRRFSLGYAPAKLPVKRDIAIFPILLSLQTASNNIPSHARTKQESNSQRMLFFLPIHSGIHQEKAFFFSLLFSSIFGSTVFTSKESKQMTNT